MTKLRTAVALFMLLIGESVLMAESQTPIKVLDMLQGGSFLAIQAALAVLEPRKLDLEKYQIVVVLEAAGERGKETVTVLFIEKKTEAAAPKNYGVRIRPDRELSAGDVNTLVTRLDQLKILDRIQGANYPPVAVAAAVFKPRKPEWTAYKIDVVRDGESVVVIFLDKDRKPGTRGGGGVHPGFEVEMRPADLEVLRSNFVK